MSAPEGKEAPKMSLLCYNKGCGQKFHADQNNDGENMLNLDLQICLF